MIPRWLIIGLSISMMPLLTLGATLTEPAPRVQRGVSVPMRDGVKLIADVYLPPGRGPWPVIVLRTPYNRAGGEGAAQPFRAHYAVVVQDTRGRFESGGEFTPFFPDVNDGYDTVEWAASQPWSDGQVGMTGGSYLGIVQVLAAIAHPPHLKAIFPVVTPSDFYGDTVFTGGALRQELFEGWMAGMAATARPPSSTTPAFGPDRLGELFKHLPLRDPKPVEAGGPAYVRAWENMVAHPFRDSFWDPIRVTAHFDQVNVPALFVGGWYDIFGPATAVNFRGWREHGASTAARQGTRMLVGPWTHGVNGPAGDLDPGAVGRVDLNALAVRWFDHWLRGVDNGIDREPPARVFALGANTWRDYPDWPPPDSHARRLYLTPASAGDIHAGTLSQAHPRGKLVTRFRYDPADPVPTTGGPTFLVPAGQKDQRTVETRPDVALFTTPPLKQAVEIAGEVNARLLVRSSEPDTDFTAKLVVVQPDGRAVNLLDSIRRLQTYRSYDRPRQITPGRAVPLEIDLGAIDVVLSPGSRIRLEISSSNFPRFDRNPNTGARFGTGTTLRTADNEVLQGEEMSSLLSLPIRSGRL